MNKKVKWNLYEKKNKFRSFYFHKVIRRHICEKYFNIDPVIPFYANKWLMSKRKTNEWIAEKIKKGEPFMVARFGNTELCVMTSVLKRRIFGETEENEKRFEEWFARLGEGAGFFPVKKELAEVFTDLMVEASREVDMLAIWYCEMDDYVVSEYMDKCKMTHLNYIEPWRTNEPWSKALQGKKVLVIHPFEESIKKQYEKRKILFSNLNVLPDFELRTLKAVQTAAGEVDERFETWFDALEYMYQEALKIEFDVAIIGCGAYGFPLAAKLKKAGKSVIHMGGATQILFGIKGRRWVDNPRAQVKFNDAWEYPLKNEKPQNSIVVENNCYW